MLELLTKARILAISKCDLLEDTPDAQSAKRSAQLSEELEIPVVCISAVSGLGISELKDMLWVELNKEQNQVIEISHAPIDIAMREEAESDVATEDDDEQQTIYLNEVEEEWDLNKYKGIGWDE